jgi:hypothetical protein
MALETISTVEQVKQLSKEILDDLEINHLPISQVLMKTMRLARLLHDTDAQNWINFEIKGYPDKFDPETLGNYKKYYCKSYNLEDIKRAKILIFSLPSLESFIKDMALENFCSSNNADDLVWAIDIRHGLIHQYEEQKLSIHTYVTDVFLSLSIGDIGENIFQDARIEVDLFIQENCSKDAKEKLLSINERFKENNTEAYAQALLSCRRMLVSIADAIFPAQTEPYIDRKGVKHNVSLENYKNRIIAFIGQNIISESNLLLYDSNIEHLAKRLDAINEESNKGLHNFITKEEARLTIIQMYLIIAEIARIKQNGNLIEKVKPTE